ncbi:uncharacterized protein LOC108153664 isoform X1 [Drosophila miranda]|uniref:uncharacterized protein LOC108153664 isoform X1 n=1 Tax=Drosophila miranda TaxID=7229 RepID=UPI0007E65450|nr:uncharacterized protein LOC108153664 isoform X1 [Drosophila miranda]
MSACIRDPPQTLMFCYNCKAVYRGVPFRPCPQCCARYTFQQPLYCPEEFEKFSAMGSPCFQCKQPDCPPEEDGYEKCPEDAAAKGKGKKVTLAIKKGQKQKTEKPKTKAGTKQTVRANNEPKRTGKKTPGKGQGPSGMPGKGAKSRAAQEGSSEQGTVPRTQVMQGMTPCQCGVYPQQRGMPVPGTQVPIPRCRIGPFGAIGPEGSAPNTGYADPGSMPLGCGAQGMTCCGLQCMPGYCSQGMQIYEADGQTSNIYGAPGPVRSPYSQPGLPNGQYGAGTPPGCPPVRAAGLPSKRGQQFNPCTGELVCTCRARCDLYSRKSPQKNNSYGEGCDQYNRKVEAFQRVLKSLQLCYPANGLQDCCLQQPIDLEMANKTGEGEPKRTKKSSPKRKPSKSDTNSKKAASPAVAPDAKSNASVSPSTQPAIGEDTKAVTPDASTANAPCACPPAVSSRPSMRSFCCNTSCMISSDECTQTASGKSNKYPSDCTPDQGEPAAAPQPPSSCQICCNGNCNSCCWPYYYCYNPYTGCYYWYPNPNCCNGCQSCCAPNPLEKIPEKPQGKEAAPGKRASAAAAAAGPKGKKKNDRKVGGGPELMKKNNLYDERMSCNQSFSLGCNQGCNLICAIPKAPNCSRPHQPFEAGSYPRRSPTAQPRDCSPYGQIGVAGKIGGKNC